MPAAATKTKPETVELISISEIARRCKLDRATVTSRLEDLGYEPDESSTAKNQLYYFDDEMEFAVKSAKDTLTAIKIRQLRADAQMKELKYAEARGDLVEINLAIERVQQVMTRLYKELTQMQPKRLASRLVKAKTTAEVTKIIKADTDKVFSRLRENDEAFVPAVKK